MMPEASGHISTRNPKTTQKVSPSLAADFRLSLLYQMKSLILAIAALALIPALAQEENYPTPPEALRQDGVPQGKLIKGKFSNSKIFPGTERDYAVYIPAQYDGKNPAALMVFQDGMGYCNDNGGARAHVVFDNLISSMEMPVTIGVFINPGVTPPLNPDQSEARYNRSYEYDGMGDNYARFLIQEILPFIEKTHDVKLTNDPNLRGICGASSGAIAAFTVAWERPDSFRRVYSMIGTFVGLRGGDDYPELIRRTEPKPLRVFLQDGENDNNIYAGDWWMANQAMLRALQWSGYEVEHKWGRGQHNGKHGSSIFPEAMRWLWKTETVTTHPENSQSKFNQYLIPGEDWEVVSEGHQWAEGMLSLPDGTLFFTDVPAGELYKISPDGKKELVDGDTGNANGIALGPDGLIYGAASGASEIRTWNPATGEKKTISEGTKSNDIVVTNSGHVYYTDPSAGKIWHLAPGTHQRSEADPNFREPNGIALSADHSLLYVADFKGRFIYSYQIQPDGSLKHKQPYFYAQLPVNGPAHLDGMTSLITGELLSATELGIQISDQPGRVQIVLSRPNISDKRTCYVTFGGKDRKTLYVATPGAIYKRLTKMQGADPMSPNKPPKPGL